jgi:hypothetical protein
LYTENVVFIPADDGGGIDHSSTSPGDAATIAKENQQL